ncbi:MAG: hypothetical protein LBQ39_03080 [Tannerellaceae bacterium]|jgi:hypothetical protein|nr:hypothetical protein [Tannerellaceae bacterium]
MMKRSGLVFLFLFSLFAGLQAEGESGAGEKKPVGIDFFTKVKRISNLKEHNGDIFFTLSQADKEGNSYTPPDLYQLIDGKPVRLA